MMEWEDVDWNVMIPLLLLYTARKIGRAPSAREGMLYGYSPSDIVNDSAIKIIDGERKHENQNKDDPYDFLTSVIDSHMNHLHSKPENKNKEQYCPEENPNHVKECMTNVEKQVLSIIDMEKFLEYSKNRDNYIGNIIENLVKNDIFKNKDISLHLNISIEEANNIKRRIKRMIDTYHERGDGHAQ